MSQIQVGPRFVGPGELGNIQSGSGTLFNNVVSVAVGILTLIAIVWFVFLLITGAISYIQSGGDQAQAEAARKKITTAIIGIIIVLTGLLIVELLGEILGFDILNPGEFLFGTIVGV